MTDYVYSRIAGNTPLMADLDGNPVEPTLPEAEVPETPVVFRRWYRKSDGTGVIALFPDEPWGPAGMVSSFEHAGQHGAADYDMVMRRTRPAKPAEYAALAAELERPPYSYNLAVRKRRNGRQS